MVRNWPIRIYNGYRLSVMNGGTKNLGIPSTSSGRQPEQCLGWWWNQLVGALPERSRSVTLIRSYPYHFWFLDIYPLRWVYPLRFGIFLSYPYHIPALVRGSRSNQYPAAAISLPCPYHIPTISLPTMFLKIGNPQFILYTNHFCICIVKKATILVGSQFWEPISLQYRFQFESFLPLGHPLGDSSAVKTHGAPVWCLTDGDGPPAQPRVCSQIM